MRAGTPRLVELYQGHVFAHQWYPVLNDLVGGWAVANRHKPVADLELWHHEGEDYVAADGITSYADAHLIALLMTEAGIGLAWE